MLNTRPPVAETSKRALIPSGRAGALANAARVTAAHSAPAVRHPTTPVTGAKGHAVGLARAASAALPRLKAAPRPAPAPALIRVVGPAVGLQGPPASRQTRPVPAFAATSPLETLALRRLEPSGQYPQAAAAARRCMLIPSIGTVARAPPASDAGGPANVMATFTPPEAPAASTVLTSPSIDSLAGHASERPAHIKPGPGWLLDPGPVRKWPEPIEVFGPVFPTGPILPRPSPFHRPYRVLARVFGAF